jgi:hypothetical protein
VFTLKVSPGSEYICRKLGWKAVDRRDLSPLYWKKHRAKNCTIFIMHVDSPQAQEQILDTNAKSLNPSSKL